MYISFFHFEVRVASGDSRVVILPGSGSTICRSIWAITVHVMAVELANYKDVNGHEESVSWL